MSDHSPSVVILGGGFGGLQTALRLSQFPWPDEQRPNILLIDQNSHFLFLPLLYELVTNELETWEIAPPFSELLANTQIQFRQATVQAIDLDQQQVSLTSGESVSYDRLILALGSETPLDIVPGAAEYALPFHSVAHAHQLKDRLRLLEASDKDTIRVAVVGGGASGVELACKLADRLGKRGQIRLVERADRLLQQSPDYNRTAAQKSLDHRGIWIDLETTIRQITDTELVLAYKDKEDTISVDLVLWTVGNAIAPSIRTLPVQHSSNGRIVTDVTLQVTEHLHVFALGDLADCRDANQAIVPTTAQSAIQQADCVAWNIWASLNQRPLLPFRYTHLGEMLTLGTDSAALAGLGVTLDGPFAYLARRLIYLYRMPTLEHQIKVGLNWITKPLLTAFQPPSS
jgi:demethylphylloquinone reductase